MKRTMSATALAVTLVSAALYKAGPASAESGVVVSPQDSRPAAAGPADTFTGTVTVQPLFDPAGVRTSGAAEVTFAPCARTAWHTHPAGQTLMVTSGTGWV